MKKHPIILKNVCVHNLKGVDLTLQTNELIVFTGVSGSGKSSLAFDTIFIEGQRRYIESLSTFARRYLGDFTKPEVELVSGLSPTISIEQKSAHQNPRSTVGTMTEIYDHLRVLYARVAIPHCPVSGEAVSPQSKEKIIRTIQALPENSKIIFLAPFVKNKKGEFKEDFQLFLKKGFTKARIDNHIVDISEEISLEKNSPHTIDLVVDRLNISTENHSRIAEAVMNSLDLGNGVMSIYEIDREEETLYSTQAFSLKSGLSYSSLEPQDFSFNNPSGMCLRCKGLGQIQEFDLQKILDPEKSIAQDCCVIASSYQTVRYGNIYQNLAQIYGFDVHTPWKNLSEKAKKIFLYGSDKKWLSMHFVHPTREQSWTEYVHWSGVLHEAQRKYMEATSETYRKKIQEWMHMGICTKCQGSRLRPYPAASKLKGYKIHELCQMDINNLSLFFQSLHLDPIENLIAKDLLQEISRRLHFLLDVGLHYLSLDRAAPTLSGGEAQRVRLASQVGCGLVGVTYVLDEPSIGLHPRDNKKLIATLKQLRDVGNTVIVVEHDEETIWEADRVVDFGPGPGVRGGKILVNGTHKELLAHPQSLTGAFLSGKRSIALPKERRLPTEKTIQILGAEHNNLKKIHVTLPLGIFLAVTGVSGSGKSSLITDILYPALANHLHHAQHRVGKHEAIIGIEKINKVISIDQSPIGRTPRSNPATYVKILDEIRILFSKLPESMARGFSPGRFSFNVRDGSCSECQGIGMIRVNMDFLEDQWIPCQSCQSKRFDHETLSIHYKGKNIHDILEMSVLEAKDFFSNIPVLQHKLDVLTHVGMGYIKLGQSSTTLSGGEAQRIKLAKELVRPGTGNTFYILDEPTTGLHFQDIAALLEVLQELVSRGNTVLVIEHNMDVVKTADWIVDLGPEGGAQGGMLIAAGTPETLAKMDTPTGDALKQSLISTKHALKKTKKAKVSEIQEIIIMGAEQNNLKHVDISIPRGKLTICTGPSGSGKSSLAFDTIYAEGQRRYIESLSPYARQFVHQSSKPKIEEISGLSPAIAIEQKAAAGNPRSTVGTLTEAYDYLRILFAHAGKAYDPETGEEIKSITKEYVVEKILGYPQGEKITILAPLEIQKNEKFEDCVARLKHQGFVRLRLNQQIYELDEAIPFDRKRKNVLALVIDRLTINPINQKRIFEAVEQAAQIGNDKLIVMKESGDIFFNLSFAVESSGKSYPEITPQTFSFNSAEGMCKECQGLGYVYGANLVSNLSIMQLSIIELVSYLWKDIQIPFFL